MSEIVAEYNVFPQKMINVSVSNAKKTAKEICSNQDVLDAVEQAEKSLLDKGRILLRPSGTEPLIRVMVEGEDEQLVHQCCEQLADKVQQLIS